MAIGADRDPVLVSGVSGLFISKFSSFENSHGSQSQTHQRKRERLRSGCRRFCNNPGGRIKVADQTGIPVGQVKCDDWAVAQRVSYKNFRDEAEQVASPGEPAKAAQVRAYI